MNVVFSYSLLRYSRRFLHGVSTAALAASIFITHTALAQTGDDPAADAGNPTLSLGDVFCSVHDNIQPIGSLFSWFCYAAGLYFMIQGILHIKDRVDSPAQNPLSKGLTYLGVAAALFTIPSFAWGVILTLFGTPGTGGSTACSWPGAVAAASNVTLDVMMTNLVTNIKTPMLMMLSVTAMAMGLYLIIRGLMKATKHGTDPKTHSMTNIYTSLIIGAALLATGSNVNVFMNSIFGTTGMTDANTVTQWAAIQNLGSNMTQFQNAIMAVLTFFQLVGFISFIRGWTILRQAVEGQGQHTISQGLTHIIGGVIAINIYGFLPIMNSTFGTNVTAVAS